MRSQCQPGFALIQHKNRPGTPADDQVALPVNEPRPIGRAFGLHMYSTGLCWCRLTGAIGGPSRLQPAVERIGPQFATDGRCGPADQRRDRTVPQTRIPQNGYLLSLLRRQMAVLSHGNTLLGLDNKPPSQRVTGMFRVTWQLEVLANLKIPPELHQS